MQTERQKEIIEAALDLINKKGIQGLTIKNLSKKIGFSEPAIYRHYDNKIQILLAILDYFKLNSEKTFVNELKGNYKAIDKIDHIFSKHYKTFSENPSLVSVLFSEEIFRGEPELMKKINEIIEKNGNILTQIIDEGQKNHEIRTDIDANHFAVIIMGSLRLFIKKWHFSGYSFDILEEGKKLIESIKKLVSESQLAENDDFGMLNNG